MLLLSDICINISLSALADVLVLSNTPTIQDRINALPYPPDPLPHHLTHQPSFDSNDRMSRKSQKDLDFHTLHGLWKEQSTESEELRRVLNATSDRLEQERDQAAQLEKVLKEVRLREATARMARKRAEAEASKAAAEARAYKLSLDMANFENTKAQEQVNNLALERREADAAAARARSTAHRLREKLVRERALQEGRSQGMNEGLRIGYDDGMGDGWADGHDEGFGDMRKRAFAIWEQAIKAGAINTANEFDLDKAFRAERRAAPQIAHRGPSRRASARESLNRYPPSGHARTRSNPHPYRAQITSSEDLSSPTRTPRRPPPQFMPEQPPIISEVPPTTSGGIQVTVTSPQASDFAPSPKPFQNPSSSTVHIHPPVEPMFEGTIPMADENGRIYLPPPHDINPSPGSVNAPLPSISHSHAPSIRAPSPSVGGQRTPRSRNGSFSAAHPPVPVPLNGEYQPDPFPDVEPPHPRSSRNSMDNTSLLAREAEKLRQELLEIQQEEIKKQRAEFQAERARLEEQLAQERALYAADVRAREEQEEARERQRQLEKEAEVARVAERERERATEREQEHLLAQELALQKARASEKRAETEQLQAEVDRARAALQQAERQREMEREAERKLAVEREMERRITEEAAQRQREIEREAADRLVADRLEQERSSAERIANERAMNERMASEYQHQQKLEAARAEQEQLAARERFQAEQVASLTQKLQQQRERDLPNPPLSVRNNADYDSEDDDPTTDDAVPYGSDPRQPGERRPRKRGSVYSAKTGRTGMSTPLSQFTILEDVDPGPGAPTGGRTSAQRKQDMQRHRESTLARERQRDVGSSSRQPYMPVIPETASQTNDTDRMVPRTPHESLPALPVKLDKQYPPPMGPASPPESSAYGRPSKSRSKPRYGSTADIAQNVRR